MQCQLKNEKNFIFFGGEMPVSERPKSLSLAATLLALFCPWRGVKFHRDGVSLQENAHLEEIAGIAEQPVVYYVPAPVAVAV